MKPWWEEGLQWWNIGVYSWSIDEEVIERANLVAADDCEVSVVAWAVNPDDLLFSRMLWSFGTASKDQVGRETFV